MILMSLLGELIFGKFQPALVVLVRNCRRSIPMHHRALFCAGDHIYTVCDFACRASAGLYMSSGVRASHFYNFGRYSRVYVLERSQDTRFFIPRACLTLCIEFEDLLAKLQS